MTTFQTKPAVPASAAILCMLLATATLAGWGLHSPSLIGATISAPQMYPLTAAGFICAGASVLLQLHPVRPIARAGRLPA